VTVFYAVCYTHVMSDVMTNEGELS